MDPFPAPFTVDSGGDVVMELALPFHEGDGKSFPNGFGGVLREELRRREDDGDFF